MTRWRALGEFLRTDPRDVGCERAMEVLDVYVDVVRADGAEAAERRVPGVAAHLRACGPAARTSTACLQSSLESPRRELRTSPSTGRVTAAIGWLSRR